MLARNIFFNEDEEDGIGILVKTNAESISKMLDVHQIKHLTITNKDMFKTVNFKALYGHFSLLQFLIFFKSLSYCCVIITSITYKDFSILFNISSATLLSNNQ